MLSEIIGKLVWPVDHRCLQWHGVLKDEPYCDCRIDLCDPRNLVRVGYLGERRHSVG
ncbi:MAG TPA: hypothetical protein VIY68_19950 [Steroidobacteraceae bacterium]